MTLSSADHEKSLAQNKSERYVREEQLNDPALERGTENLKIN